MIAAKNYYLYKKLMYIFGQNNVKIAKAGEDLRIVFSNIKSPKLLNFGETYRINCPFCQRHNYVDKNFHLWISHGWGTKYFDGFPDNVGIKCFRHDCLNECPELATKFKNIIYGSNIDINTFDIKLLNYPDNIQDKKEEILTISNLLNHRDTEAYDYVVKKVGERNADYVCERFSLGYCEYSDKSFEIGGLYIPVYDEYNNLVTRQIRCFNNKIKYSSGPRISNYIYNINRIKSTKNKKIILVEGCSDVWKLDVLGYDAIAVFGHFISLSQRTLLTKYFGDSLITSLDKELLLMLDGDIEIREISKTIKDFLYRKLNFKICYLPKDKDPADLDSYSLDLIISSAKKANNVNINCIT